MSKHTDYDLTTADRKAVCTTVSTEFRLVRIATDRDEITFTLDEFKLLADWVKRVTERK